MLDLISIFRILHQYKQPILANRRNQFIMLKLVHYFLLLFSVADSDGVDPSSPSKPTTDFPANVHTEPPTNGSEKRMTEPRPADSQPAIENE